MTVLDSSLVSRRASDARRLRDVFRLEMLQVAAPWTRLPSEAEIAQRYSVSRNTVREALNLLRDEGLVKRVQGSGTFWTGPSKRLQVLTEPEGSMYHELLDFRDAKVYGSIATRLGLPEGSAAKYLERRTMYAAEPASFWSTYMLHSYAESLQEAGVDLADPFQGMWRSPLSQLADGADWHIEAVTSDADVSALLALRTGSPILLLHRTLVFGGVPVEVAIGRFRADRIVMSVRQDGASSFAFSPDKSAVELDARKPL